MLPMPGSGLLSGSGAATGHDPSRSENPFRPYGVFHCSRPGQDHLGQVAFAQFVCCIQFQPAHVACVGLGMAGKFPVDAGEDFSEWFGVPIGFRITVDPAELSSFGTTFRTRLLSLNALTCKKPYVASCNFALHR